MNRSQAKRHIKATTYSPKIGIGPYLKQSKAQASAEIERQMEEFFERGGHIKELTTQQSEFRPTWVAYARGSFEDNHHEG